MKRYVLVTAAYNEQALIENLINSIVAQTHRPDRWIVVSDGSTDKTDEIVDGYASRFDFIQLHRISEDHPRNFTAQVHAINRGFSQLKPCDFDYIGNVDSDITLEPTYFSDLLAKFESDPKLGLAGGYIWELENSTFRCRRSNSPLSVAHGIQLFRRECLEQIGGAYVPMPYGGPDWHAEVSARLNGWKVKAFVDLKAYHHRRTGQVAGLLKTCCREGFMDHSMGTHPCFELFRVARRLHHKPYLVGSIVRFCAYVLASARRQVRPVSEDFVRFLREYELQRLKRLLSQLDY